MKIAASKSNYEKKKEHVNIYRRDKYALNEPKAYARQQYVADLQKKLFSKPSLRLELRKDFKQSHENIARKLSKGVLTKTVCRITARRLLDRVVKKRRERVGQLLKCVRVVNSFELSSLNLGERWHTASSEPFFYDTAYMPMKQNNAIPVDEYGRCCTAEEVGDRVKNTMRPKKWKCTEDCKLATDEEISSIVAAKELFKKSMQELRNGLESIDKGCQHGHYTDQCFAAKFTSQLDEQEQFHDLLGLPFPCAIGMCSSLLRTLRAASTHYPRMRRFLVLLYSARNHHRQIYAIDGALGLVDFNLLMDAAGISHCEELCQSECESSQENLAAGLPSLEPLLQVKHANLITKLEKEVGDDPEYQRVR